MTYQPPDIIYRGWRPRSCNPAAISSLRCPTVLVHHSAIPFIQNLSFARPIPLGLPYSSPLSRLTANLRSLRGTDLTTSQKKYRMTCSVIRLLLMIFERNVRSQDLMLGHRLQRNLLNLHLLKRMLKM